MLSSIVWLARPFALSTYLYPQPASSNPTKNVLPNELNTIALLSVSFLESHYYKTKVADSAGWMLIKTETKKDQYCQGINEKYLD